jgi:hypothetical protein
MFDKVALIKAIRIKEKSILIIVIMVSINNSSIGSAQFFPG